MPLASPYVRLGAFLCLLLVMAHATLGSAPGGYCGRDAASPDL